MNNLMTRLALVSALAALLGAATFLPAAEAEKAPKEKKPAAEKKSSAPRGTVFRGTVAALDKVALTLTITNKSSSRVFQITSETRFFKKEKPATLSEVVVGDVVGGSYVPTGEKLNLLTVRDSGPDEKAAKQEKKQEKKEEKAEKKAAKQPAKTPQP